MTANLTTSPTNLSVLRRTPTDDRMPLSCTDVRQLTSTNLLQATVNLPSQTSEVQIPPGPLGVFPGSQVVLLLGRWRLFAGRRRLTPKLTP